MGPCSEFALCGLVSTPITDCFGGLGFARSRAAGAPGGALSTAQSAKRGRRQGRFEAVEKRPRGRFSVRQGGDGVFGNARPGKGIARGTGGGIETWAQTVDDDDRHLLGYFAPLLPAMETPQIVRAHDPDESDAGAPGQQPRYRIVSVSRLNDSFETGDVDARMAGERACGRNSFGERSKATRILQWVAGCNQPPDAIELETLEREESRCKMGLMRRIECSAEQPDPHAGRMRGE